MIKSIRQACLWLLVSSTLTWSQYTSQQISGTVRDSSGGVIPAARVTVRQLGTGFTRQAAVGDSGYYVVANIPIGEYELEAEADGFQKFIQRGLRVGVNDKITADPVLTVGTVAESVTVTADAAMVDTTS
jgi:hypothetical protein